MALERYPLRLPDGLRERVEAVKKDRSLNVCFIRAIEQWTECEEAAGTGSPVPADAYQPHEAQRKARGRTVEQRSEDERAGDTETARRRRPTSSQNWGSGR